MEPGEALSTAAQIAVTLAGFAGVVVAFRSGPLHEWSLLDKYRLWLLLANALVPFFACLFAMLMLTITPVPQSIWQWCSGLSMVFVFVFGVLSRRQQLRIAQTEFQGLGKYRYLFYLMGALGTLIAFLQIYNIVVARVFWLFYLAVVFQLTIGALQFARMILLPPHTKA